MTDNSYQTSFTKEYLNIHLDSFKKVIAQNPDITVKIEHLDSAGFQFLLALNKACIIHQGFLHVQTSADLGELLHHNGWTSKVDIV